MSDDALIEKALTATLRKSKQTGGFHRQCAEQAIREYRRLLSEAGLAVVPVEPSQRMLIDATNDTPEGHDLARAIYRIMVAAARES